MATTNATLRAPTKWQIAKAISAALPGELSNSPVLGIIGVVMGAGIVTLAGRLLSLGTADLKGSLGIGYDDGAWIGSAFNIALMFIGPFTVYLGGLLGARRVLIIAASGFTLVNCLLPFAHTYNLLLVGLALAGLTSGTFYPLTLSFSLRNIPLRFLPFTLALYATFVDGAVNVAPTMYGWFRDHLSFRWMFWSMALLTPIMLFCIYKRNSSESACSKTRSGSELRRISLRECRVCLVVCRSRSRPAPRLVAIRIVQRTIFLRPFLSGNIDTSAFAQPEPPCRSAVS